MGEQTAKQPNAEGAKSSQKTQKIPMSDYLNDSFLRLMHKDYTSI